MLSQYTIEYATLMVTLALTIISFITLIVMVVKPLFSMYMDYRQKVRKYKRAIREGMVYDNEIKTLPDAGHRLVLYWITRNTDHKSVEYGFYSVVKKFNIDDPEDFLKYVVKTQSKQPDAFSYGELEYLLIVH